MSCSETPQSLRSERDSLDRNSLSEPPAACEDWNAVGSQFLVMAREGRSFQELLHDPATAAPSDGSAGRQSEMQTSLRQTSAGSLYGSR